MNKKGLELSINFIVMLIIAIVIFSFGLKISYDIFFSAQNQVNTVNQQTKQQLEGILSGGSKVAIPLGIKKLKSGESYTLGVGIYNVLDKPINFEVGIEKGSYYPNERSSGEAYEDEIQILNSRSQEINPNDKAIIIVPIKVSKGAKRGTYVLNVYACDNSPCDRITNQGNVYGDRHQLMINVN